VIRERFPRGATIAELAEATGWERHRVGRYVKMLARIRVVARDRTRRSGGRGRPSARYVPIDALSWWRFRAAIFGTRSIESGYKPYPGGRLHRLHIPSGSPKRENSCLKSDGDELEDDDWDNAEGEGSGLLSELEQAVRLLLPPGEGLDFPGLLSDES
jgi:hypothetical protein